MTISQNGLDLIKSFEGLRLTAYTATEEERLKNIWTIGYGNTYYPDGKKVKQGDTLSSASEAAGLLRAAVKDFERGVNEAIKVPMTQNQFDAMVSLAYNIGVGAFKKSTLVANMNKINTISVANEFPKWNKAGGKVLTGLMRRRAAERELFLK